MLIRIKNLRLRGVIGVNPWEKTDKQALIVNLEMEFDGSKAAQSDNVADTIDYRDVSKKIIDHVENTQYELIETLADKLLGIVMSDQRVLAATVEIDKPNAVKSADSTSVVTSGRR